DGGGRPLGRPQRRTGAVGLACGIRRRDGAGRRAGHSGHGTALRRGRYPRLRRGAGIAGAGTGPPPGYRPRAIGPGLRPPSGPAHGAELPGAAAAAPYAAGFAIATALLHALGIGIAWLAGSERGRLVVRGAGALVAAGGLVLAVV